MYVWVNACMSARMYVCARVCVSVYIYVYVCMPFVRFHRFSVGGGVRKAGDGTSHALRGGS